MRQIKLMIAKAGTLQEIERLQQMLQKGQMPGTEQEQEMEEDQ